MWWKLGALLEVTIIRLGQDGENWNDPCLVLWIPLRRKVERIDGVVTFFSFFTLLVVSKVWFKGTSIEALEEGGEVTFSFNFPFPLEAIFHLPPSTCVFVKLARASMKVGLILSLKGISRVGVLSFGQSRYRPH
jgi:hypothetical protein